MKETSIQKINTLIAKGFEERASTNSKSCCDFFLLAWEELVSNAPTDYTDFAALVADFNQGDGYDWFGWIWDICEELETASSDHKECLTERLQFIQAFRKRFPDTTDEDLIEFLQRNLIKTNFILGNDKEGAEAVATFYQSFPDSVWGYIEWGDALLKRTPTDKEAALAIYKKGLTLKDDPDYLDILKRRIRKV